MLARNYSLQTVPRLVPHKNEGSQYRWIGSRPECDSATIAFAPAYFFEWQWGPRTASRALQHVSRFKYTRLLLLRDGQPCGAR